MNRWSPQFLGVLLLLLLFPEQSSAAWKYTPEGGWERIGEGSWVRPTAKEQLSVAVGAFEGRDYSLALKAARSIVRHREWRFGDYAAPAQYLVGRCYETKGQDERAFKAYQELLTKHPKVDYYDEVVLRQFVIADRFLAGQWFKLWGYIPFFPSMDKTIAMYQQIIKNGPFSKVGPYAQLRIGAAHENKFAPEFEAAAKAYEQAADRYNDLPAGTEGLFKAGEALQKQAKRAEYDQSAAGRAISTFSDFMTLHPNDQRVPEAQKSVDLLKIEQARGSFEIARYYEKRHLWKAARIYYNDVLYKDPGSRYGEEARRRIDEINRRLKE